MDAADGADDSAVAPTMPDMQAAMQIASVLIDRHRSGMQYLPNPELHYYRTWGLANVKALRRF
jgi:hypothetical protein